MTATEALKLAIEQEREFQHPNPHADPSRIKARRDWLWAQYDVLAAALPSAERARLRHVEHNAVRSIIHGYKADLSALDGGGQ